MGLLQVILLVTIVALSVTKPWGQRRRKQKVVDRFDPQTVDFA